MCVHLPGGEGQGFFQADTTPDGDGRPNAWCGACERRRLAGGGEWTDETEPQITLVCTECWDTFRRRNLLADRS